MARRRLGRGDRDHKTTEAFIGSGSLVTGKGAGTVGAHTGSFTSASTADTASQTVAAGSDPTALRGANLGVAAPGAPSSGHDLSSDSSADGFDSDRLTRQRTVSADTRQVSGVAVTAVNQDRIKSFGVSGGASGTVAVNVSGGVDVLTNRTSAHVDGGAVVNGAAGSAAAAQSVLVAAGNDYQRLGVVASLAVSGGVSAAASADVSIVDNSADAHVADGATVNAARDIVVAARNSGSALTVAAGAGGGIVGIAGAVTTLVLTDTTHAYIGNSAGSTAAGAHAVAGGNVLVSASDDTDILTVAGAVGIGAVGVGGSVTVNVVDKDTQAWIGDHASVDGKGNGAGLVGVYTGDKTGDGTAIKTGAADAAHGVVVQAASSEKLFTVAAAAGGSVYFGLAGGVAVETFHSATTAHIGAGALVNKAADNATAASSAQSVIVGAVNDVRAFAFGGGLAGGFAGIGGGVDVGVVRNDTNAYIGDGAQVAARNDVALNALANRHIDTIAVSAAGGAVALAGSVSVWSIGDAVQGSYSVDQDGGGTQSQNSLSNGGKGIGDSTSRADSQKGEYASLLGNYSSSRKGPVASGPDANEQQGLAIARRRGQARRDRQRPGRCIAQRHRHHRQGGHRRPHRQRRDHHRRRRRRGEGRREDRLQRHRRQRVGGRGGHRRIGHRGQRRQPGRGVDRLVEHHRGQRRRQRRDGRRHARCDDRRQGLGRPGGHRRARRAGRGPQRQQRAEGAHRQRRQRAGRRRHGARACGRAAFGRPAGDQPAGRRAGARRLGSSGDGRRPDAGHA